ncbi:MAG: hypothetical protein GXY95_03955 [Clostridiales bacterium]|jgi:hypothetical protein|nr:hypothetical protein [Clostridiales bacterium]HOA33734.1 hypothetical protein [Clostridiales bacterium]HOJ35145.1 hypothetical protein [Clostridiales bacterium]HOL79453.1 hypothetical protein [Clostridiales bacterium]HPP68434.1 hypothetical protein [Clostridiales bacterium]
MNALFLGAITPLPDDVKLYIMYLASALLIFLAAVLILKAKPRRRDSIEQLKEVLKKSKEKYIPLDNEIIIEKENKKS